MSSYVEVRGVKIGEGVPKNLRTDRWQNKRRDPCSSKVFCRCKDGRC